MRQTYQKFDFFSFQSKSFSPKINLIFLKTIVVLENKIRSTYFVEIIFNFVHIQTNLFRKLCQIFYSFASSFLTRYQKILWGGSLGCKKLLKFTCLTMKFHNRHHTTVHFRANLLVTEELRPHTTTTSAASLSAIARFLLMDTQEMKKGYWGHHHPLCRSHHYAHQCVLNEY